MNIKGVLEYLTENSDLLTIEENKDLRKLKKLMEIRQLQYEKQYEEVIEILYTTMELRETNLKLDKLQVYLHEYLSEKGLKKSLLKGEELIGMVYKDARRNGELMSDMDKVIVSIRDRDTK